MCPQSRQAFLPPPEEPEIELGFSGTPNCQFLDCSFAPCPLSQDSYICCRKSLSILLIHMVACAGLFTRHGSDSICHTLLGAGGKHGLSYCLSSFFCPCTGVQVLCCTFLRLQQKGLNFRFSRGNIPRDSLERRGGSKKLHLGIPQ